MVDFLKRFYDDKIKLDIDNKDLAFKLVDRWAWVLSNFQDWFKVKGIKIRETSSGFHVYLSIDRLLTAEDVIILQLILGSDYKREIYNLKRLRQLGKWENILFTYKLRFSDSYISQEESTYKARELGERFIEEYSRLVV